LLRKIHTSLKPHQLLIKNFAHLGFIQITNSLLQILIFPFILRVVGIEEFGKVMVANSFAWLLTILVNYGSSQTGINDIATNTNNPQQLSFHMRVILQSRFMLFLVLLSLIFVWYFLFSHSALYFLLAMPIVFGEALNPLFYFVGIENSSTYNVANLISKIITFCLILLMIKQADQGAWVNFLIGIVNSICFGLLLFFVYLKKQVSWVNIKWKDTIHFFKMNSYLLGNNFTVYLQQSVFLFALSTTGQATILGAYSLCDKLIWSFRVLMVAVFNTVYPKGAQLYQADKLKWSKFKNKINRIIFFGCIVWAIAQYFLADFVILLVAGKENLIAANYLKWMSLVPLFIALNMLNVMELLLEKKNHIIFYIGIGILCFALIMTILLLQLNPQWYGLFPMMVESVCLLLYFKYIKHAA
jgi:O-antigen/teichoic acid export membrane protein